MKVLLDHNMPRKLRSLLIGQHVFTARELLWDRLKNGDLLREAERARFDTLLTADQGIFYQQDNSRRLISLVVLSTNDANLLLENIFRISEAIDRSYPGSFEFLTLRHQASAGHT